MGLDMYVYRVKKPGLDTSKVFDADEIHGIILSEEDIKDAMYRELLPYCDKVQAIRHYYDIEKLKAESGAKSLHLSSIIGGVLSRHKAEWSERHNLEVRRRDRRELHGGSRGNMLRVFLYRGSLLAQSV